MGAFDHSALLSHTFSCAIAHSNAWLTAETLMPAGTGVNLRLPINSCAT